MEKYIANLQRYRKEAEANKNFGRARAYRIGYFKHYSPEVQEVCWKHFRILCNRHKAKLEADKSYVRIMVATATRLALDELGITQISRKGFHRFRVIALTKVKLGIMDKHPIDRKKNRIRKVKPEPLKCEVSQGSLEGI